MPGRGRSSFNKRQKERSRQDNQREKLERKAQRKLEKQTTPSEDVLTRALTNSILGHLPPASYSLSIASAIRVKLSTKWW